MWDAIGFSKIFTVLTCGISASSRVYSPTSEMEKMHSPESQKGLEEAAGSHRAPPPRRGLGDVL